VRAARRTLEIFHKLNFMLTNDRVRLVINRRIDQGAISPAQIERDARRAGVRQHRERLRPRQHGDQRRKPLCGDHVDTRQGATSRL
jgi:hypothetical protein